MPSNFLPYVGLNGDFWWYESGGVVRTPASLAIEGACQAPYYGGLGNHYWRINSPTSEEYGTGWFETAIGNIGTALGRQAALVPVVADTTYLQDWPDAGARVYDTLDSIMAGLAAANAQCGVIVQIGNEPYIGATGTHAELDATLAARAIALSTQLKIDHPSIYTCMPPLGTMRNTTGPACEAQLDLNWAKMRALFAGHNTFDFTSANLYRFDNSGPDDDTNYGIAYGGAALRANAAALGTIPIVMELGLHNPTQAGLLEAIVDSGCKRVILWKVGAPDDFDMIGGGAIEVPPDPT